MSGTPALQFLFPVGLFMNGLGGFDGAQLRQCCGSHDSSLVLCVPSVGGLPPHLIAVLTTGVE